MNHICLPKQWIFGQFPRLIYGFPGTDPKSSTLILSHYFNKRGGVATICSCNTRSSHKENLQIFQMYQSFRQAAECFSQKQIIMQPENKKKITNVFCLFFMVFIKLCPTIGSITQGWTIMPNNIIVDSNLLFLARLKISCPLIKLLFTLSLIHFRNRQFLILMYCFRKQDYCV